MDIQPGDVLTMKKAHPCGSREWLVLRVGADFKLRCLGCAHEVMGRARSSSVTFGISSARPRNSF